MIKLILTDMDGTFLNKEGDYNRTLFKAVKKKLKEKGEHKQANVHTIHISIRCDDHTVIAKVIQGILDVQRMLEQVKLLILVHDFFGQTIAIQRLTAQTEHRLRIYITGLG